jgi:hypothetical protein
MFECHVTISPVFDDDLVLVEEIAKKHNFKVANLLMQRRKEDTPERSKNDTFMTGHDRSYNDLKNKMILLIKELQNCGFDVWRYKIEEILVDSKLLDTFDLLDPMVKR